MDTKGPLEMSTNRGLYMSSKQSPPLATTTSPSSTTTSGRRWSWAGGWIVDGYLVHSDGGLLNKVPEINPVSFSIKYLCNKEDRVSRTRPDIR